VNGNKQMILLDYLKEAFTHKPHKKCRLLVDIRGRDITIGAFENNEAYIDIEAGEDLEIFIDVESDIKSNKKRLVTPELAIDRILRKGDIIYIGDGQIKASILSVDDGVTLIRTKSEGRIYEYSSIVIPDKHSNLSVIQEQDLLDLEYLNKKHKIDYLAIPYASTDEDIKVVRRLIDPFLDQVVIMAKVEDKGVNILKEADGIIIQRRALGLSIVSEKLFSLQSYLIEQCKLKAKPVLLANEIMETMIDNKYPQRSEVSDIQNALVEGADGFILDKETSYGKYPIESVAATSKTIAETSSIIDPQKKFDTLYSVCDYSNVDELLAMSAAKIVLDTNREPIDYIITLSKQGKIARLLAKYNLPIDVQAC
jgi:pyruvate kinase